MKSKCDVCGGTRRVIEPEHENEFMGHKFKVSAKEVACSACSRFRMKAIRQDNITKAKREVDCVVEIAPPWPGCEQFSLRIAEGAVTGYESVFLEGMMNPSSVEIVERTGGWWANAGGMGWDGLFLPMAALNQAFEHMQLEGFRYGG